MKHCFIPMMLMVAAALASCNKTNLNEQKAQKESYVYTISAVAPDMVDADAPAQAPTRTDYTDGGVFSWSAGDAISVLFHNGDVNKFFTLTTTESGATVKFSGSIEAGYEIGASDGDANDKKIWALFPASENHVYTAGSNPTFYVQPSVDFTTSHFSANIPMYDLVDAEDATLSFKNMACTYKFIVNGIKSGVDKVSFTITNASELRDMSGSSEIGLDGSKYYVKYGWTGKGLTYISNVTNNQAIFYVSCRYWGEFKPTITVSNYATGDAIKTFAATAAQTPSKMNKIQPITLDVSEASGGVYYTPAIYIDGNFTDWEGKADLPNTRSGGGTNYKIANWRMTSDARNIYIYLKLINSGVTEGSYVYVGFDTAEGGTAHGGLANLEQYVVVYTCVKSSDPVAFIQGTDPRSTVNGSSDGSLRSWGVFGTGEDSSYSFVELAIPRSKVSLTSAGTIKVAVAYDYYDTIFQDLTLE